MAMAAAAVAGLVLVLSLTLCAAQTQKSSQRPEPELRNEAERANTRGCANLTLVLDNWKYAIMTQVKDLLLHDHRTVLPDYGRIQPLSDALGDLYKEFNALKERLADLSSKFGGVEAFVDLLRSVRNQALARGKPRPPTPSERRVAVAAVAAVRPKGRKRTRVVVRKIKKPLA